MTTTSKRPKALGYVRVSTAEQVEGYGLQVQEQAIRDYCRSHGLRLLGVLADEGVSGSNGLDSRVALAEALARIERGEAVSLVVYRLDRLARDLLLQETIHQRLGQAGARIVSVTEPEADGPDHTRDLIRQILGAISQYERAVIRGRMMAGKAAKKAAGGYAGGRPGYGHRAEGRALVPSGDERKAVARMKALRKQGASYREICASLSGDGFRPRHGEAWQPNVVRRILLREAR